MSEAGLKGMQLATEDIITVAKGLTADEWKLPSAAQGWTVHDVVAHAGNLLGVVMQAVAGELEAPDGMGIEKLNDLQVAETKDKTPEELIDFLESQLAKAIPAFTPLQDEPYYSMEAALLDLGELSVARRRRHVHLRLHDAPAIRHSRSSRSRCEKHGTSG